MASSGSTAYRKTVFLAGMASYLDAAALGATGYGLVLYQDMFDIGPGALGLLSGILTITFAIGALFGGRLGDRYGRRRVFTLSLVFYVAGTAVLAGALGTPMLYVGIVLTGFAIGADLPVSFALIAEVAPPGKKGRLLTATGLFWVAGAVIPGLLASVVGPLGDVGARILFGSLVLVAVVVLALRRSTAESPEWLRQRARMGAGEDDVDFRRVRSVFRPPLVSAFVAIGVVYLFSFLALNTFQQFGTYIFVSVVGAEISEVALISLISIPIAVASALVLMRVADRPARRPWIAVGAVFATLAYLVPVVFGLSVPTLTLTIVFTAFGATFCGEGIYKIWAEELFPTMIRSTAMGITIALVRVFAGTAAIFTPLALQADLSLTFLTLALATGVGGVVAVFVVPRLQRVEGVTSRVAKPALRAEA